MAAPAKYEGIYEWTYAGGTFEVHLRPGKWQFNNMTLPCTQISTSLLSRTSPATHVSQCIQCRRAFLRSEVPSKCLVGNNWRKVACWLGQVWQVSACNYQRISSCLWGLCSHTQTCVLLPTVSHAYILHHVSHACVYYRCLYTLHPWYIFVRIASCIHEFRTGMNSLQR